MYITLEVYIGSFGIIRKVVFYPFQVLAGESNRLLIRVLFDIEAE